MSEKGSEPTETERRELKDIMEIFGASHRAGAIVAATRVEDALEKAISRRFIELNEEERKTIFRGIRAPLSDFFSKIEIGYALAVFSKAVKEDLHLIREIRNQFAHEIDVKEFDHGRVPSLCDQLHFPYYVEGVSTAFRLPVDMANRRDRFERTSSFLTQALRQMDNALMAPPRPTPWPRAFGGYIDYPRHAVPATSLKKDRVRPTHGRRGPGRNPKDGGGQPQS